MSRFCLLLSLLCASTLFGSPWHKGTAKNIHTKWHAKAVQIKKFKRKAVQITGYRPNAAPPSPR